MAITPVAGTKLSVKFSAAFVELGNVLSIGDNAKTSEPIILWFVSDMTPTKLGSGRADPGQFSFSVAYDNGSAQHSSILGLVGLQGTNAVKEFKLESPVGDAQTFEAIVTEFSRSYADTHVVANITLELATGL